MSRRQKADLVDGLTVVRIVRHAREGDVPHSPPPPPPKAEPQEKRTHIGHTVLPTRHVLRCYECGYEFVLTARSPKTYCPKCRTILEWKDYLIQDEWTQSVKTVGIIRVGPSAVVRRARLVGTDVIIEGRLENSTVEASRWLEIARSDEVDLDCMKGARLRIATGATLQLEAAQIFEQIEVKGHLKGNVRATDRVHIFPGGLVSGRLECPRLCVEEGGGLCAAVRVIGEHAGSDVRGGAVSSALQTPAHAVK